MHSSGGHRGEGGGCLCLDLMVEQLQRPELATAGRDMEKRGRAEGLRWLVSADMNYLWGEICRKYTVTTAILAIGFR